MRDLVIYWPVYKWEIPSPATKFLVDKKPRFGVFYCLPIVAGSSIVQILNGPLAHFLLLN